MENNGYCSPESYQVGEVYFIRDKSASTDDKYIPVKFLSYRPHPAELVIKEKGLARVIHRRLLFVRKRNDEDNVKE